ncbi:peptidase E [Paenibacillus sp. USDA918EY]|uniref:Type 1 glutamine amidotransferase-like domain-containing protein n=1 Tax=Paenibacillus sp. USDA918EY TaxID=2689575 RepID=UPI0013599EC2|nr:peptidase E [Paenibacillus sp. USDA918EY]
MRQVIALGGGGFSMEPDNPLLDQYILRQSAARTPKVCFVPTASGDAEGYIAGFYEAFSAFGCTASHLALSRLPTADLEDYVLEKDILYVGGGDTMRMLEIWREHGLDRILRKAWEQGVVLAGLSAGSMCWYEEGVNCDDAGQAKVVQGLGLISGSHSPHYDSEPEYRRGYHELLRSGRIGAGVGVSDGAGIHYIGGKIHRVVSSRREARVYGVEALDGEVAEIEMIPEYLGAL